MNKKNIPKKFSKSEKFTSSMYSIFTYLAWGLLIISIIFLINYFFSFKKDIYNKDFIQLCIYFVTGCFLFIFVYDEKCKQKWGLNDKKDC